MFRRFYVDMAGYGRFLPNTSTQSLGLRNYVLHLSPTVPSTATRQYANVPVKPRRPPSAFVKFIAHIKSDLMKQYPNIKATEITQQAASLWANLDQATKQKYKDEYQEQFKEYKLEMLKYEASLTDEQRADMEWEVDQLKRKANKADIKRKVEALGKPKRPKNAYVHFTEQNIKALTDNSAKALNKDHIMRCSVLWKTLPAEEKEKYIKLAREEYKVYTEKLLEWEKKMVEMGYAEFVRKSSKARDALEDMVAIGQGTGVMYPVSEETQNNIRKTFSDSPLKNNENRVVSSLDDKPSDLIKPRNSECDLVADNLVVPVKANSKQFLAGEQVAKNETRKVNTPQGFAANLNTNKEYVYAGLCVLTIFSFCFWYFRFT